MIAYWCLELAECDHVQLVLSLLCYCHRQTTLIILKQHVLASILVNLLFQTFLDFQRTIQASDVVLLSLCQDTSSGVLTTLTVQLEHL